jgi:hypothetical protein
MHRQPSEALRLQGAVAPQLSSCCLALGSSASVFPGHHRSPRHCRPPGDLVPVSSRKILVAPSGRGAMSLCAPMSGQIFSSWLAAETPTLCPIFTRPSTTSVHNFSRLMVQGQSLIPSQLRPSWAPELSPSNVIPSTLAIRLSYLFPDSTFISFAPSFSRASPGTYHQTSHSGHLATAESGGLLRQS